MSRDNSWLKRRNRGLHLTIRDIDCRDFDAEKMARDFEELGVTFFSFFAGGYVTTYPSALPQSRQSPWLKERDIAGDIVRAAHRRGIKAIAMADLSILPLPVSAAHPEWASADADGRPYENVSGMHTACIMGGYGEEYGRALVREILARYNVDAVKFGGGSYTFHDKICHCDACRGDYERTFHRPLPEHEDWDDPNWADYMKWRIEKTTQRCRMLYEMVKSVDPDMPVMGNGGCMGAVDAEGMAQFQDMIQLEGQTRVLWGEDMSSEWVPVYWVPEEASFMTTVTDRPVWVVASYWKSRCWRRAAVDYAEQKPYVAQILANGASPMVNLSGGNPEVHEDQRGFQAFRELFGLLAGHPDCYEGDSSGADVALVYSGESMVFYGRDNPEKRYMHSFRGFERALIENHIPYDVVSAASLATLPLSRYRVLILPTAACMSQGSAQAIRNFAARGGSVVATFETGLYDEAGRRRQDFLLANLFGAHYAATAHVNGEHGGDPKYAGNLQNYCLLTGEHPILEGFEGTSLLPAAGPYCRVNADGGAETLLRLGQPFIVFPEGLAYPARQSAGDPMLLVRTLSGGGRCIYLPGRPDALHYSVGMPDLSLLLANAVRWAAGGRLPAECDAPDTVYMTLRRKEGRVMVHLINFTGGQRYFRQLIPVHDIRVAVSEELFSNTTVTARRMTDGLPLAAESGGGYLTVTLPELRDYEVIVLEAAEGAGPADRQEETIC